MNQTGKAGSHGEGDYGETADQAASGTTMSNISSQSTGSLQQALTQIIVKREAQRNRLLDQVFGLGLGIVIVMYLAVLCFVYSTFSQVAKLNGNLVDGLQALGGLWHIVLILSLPPTTILGVMLRSMSFHVNSAEVGGKPTETEEGLPMTTIEEISKQLNELLDLVRKKD